MKAVIEVIELPEMNSGDDFKRCLVDPTEPNWRSGVKCKIALGAIDTLLEHGGQWVKVGCVLVEWVEVNR